MGRPVCRLVVMAVALAVLPYLTTSQTRCQDVTNSNDTGGSCNFRGSGSRLCGWSNVEDEDELDWHFEDSSYFGQNSYMALDVSSASKNEMGVLQSPVLCATGSATRSLSFRYSIELSNRCRLSVFLFQNESLTELWSSERATGVSFSDMVDLLYFQCQPGPFRILFVGEKLSNRRCGRDYNEIDIDTVRYLEAGRSVAPDYQCPSPTVPPPTSTTTTATTSTSPKPSTTTIRPTTSRTTRPPRPGTTAAISANATVTLHVPSESSGLGGGAVAAVVIVVLAVIAVAVVFIVVFIIRRKRGAAAKKTGKPVQHSNSMSNSIYMVTSGRAVGRGAGGGAPLVLPSAPPGPPQGATAPDPEADPTYQEPDCSGFALQVRKNSGGKPGKGKCDSKPGQDKPAANGTVGGRYDHLHHLHPSAPPPRLLKGRGQGQAEGGGRGQDKYDLLKGEASGGDLQASDSHYSVPSDLPPPYSPAINARQGRHYHNRNDNDDDEYALTYDETRGNSRLPSDPPPYYGNVDTVGNSGDDVGRQEFSLAACAAVSQTISRDLKPRDLKSSDVKPRDLKARDLEREQHTEEDVYDCVAGDQGGDDYYSLAGATGLDHNLYANLPDGKESETAEGKRGDVTVERGDYYNTCDPTGGYDRLQRGGEVEENVYCDLGGGGGEYDL